MSTKVRAAHVQVSTTDYQFAHGHAPRGRGSWAFFAPNSDVPFWVNDAMYGAAKRVARAHFGAHGVDSVKVGS